MPRSSDCGDIPARATCVSTRWIRRVSCRAQTLRPLAPWEMFNASAATSRLRRRPVIPDALHPLVCGGYVGDALHGIENATQELPLVQGAAEQVELYPTTHWHVIDLPAELTKHFE